MSRATDPPNTGRTREEKLKALVRKDIDGRVTTLAERALRRRQEGSS
jgi:hypothetical protein